MTIPDFRTLVWGYFQRSGRSMPWRDPDSNGSFDPYKILVSEIMLQQTQVDRVMPKYLAFIAAFPDVQALATASFTDVLKLWQGLGYSRRAKYLHDFARQLGSNNFPQTIEELTTHKGIGPNTAAAVLVYSFNQPHVFVETNIRTVIIHHFFPLAEKVSDAEILKIMEQVLAGQDPREFYWAMMDYGSYLKKQGVRNNHQSAVYKKQSKFAGSKRQLRGKVLRALTEHGGARHQQDLSESLKDTRLDEVLTELEKDGLVVLSGQQISLP